MRLGIDFGTTRTVVASVHDGRHPVVAFDDFGVWRELDGGTDKISVRIENVSRGYARTFALGALR